MGQRYSKYQRLMCPICGSPPKLNEVGERDKKVFCSGNGTHVSRGDWKRTEDEAWTDWERRRVDKTQPDFIYVKNADRLAAKLRYALPKAADFLRRVQSGEFQLPDGMTWETWLDYPYEGKFPVGYPSD